MLQNDIVLKSEKKLDSVQFNQIYDRNSHFLSDHLTRRPVKCHVEATMEKLFAWKYSGYVFLGCHERSKICFSSQIFQTRSFLFTCHIHYFFAMTTDTNLEK